MEQYSKVTYVWNEPKPKVVVPDRLLFQAVTLESKDILVGAIAAVIADSSDRSDHKLVAEMGARAGAARFLEEAGEYFNYQLSWWTLAYQPNGKLAGFIQPVVYPNSQKDGLEEATIYYMGVLPSCRGNGFGVDLLCHCTRSMQDLGVWRIFCDTDVYNLPMIEAFRRVGYQQEGEPKRVEL